MLAFKRQPGRYSLCKTLMSECPGRQEKMITPNQAAETLTISGSTLRRWASIFEDFLDPRKGKKRLYSVSDIATFSKIRDLYAKGLTSDQVKAALPVIDRKKQGEKQSSALINISDFARALELTRVDFVNLQSQLTEQAALIQALQAEVEELRKPWYRRLFKG